MIIIRTGSDIKAGSELTFGFKSTTFIETYEDVQQALRSWHFTCNRGLCAVKQVTSTEELDRRRGFLEVLDGVLDGDYGPPNVAIAKRSLLDFEKTYRPMSPSFTLIYL
ncbi:hypothetical protein HYQ46_003071 [Verticillium longisporum]